MKKLYCWWDEWYTLFARLPAKDDFITAERRYVEVPIEFYNEYLAAKKEYEKKTKQLIRKYYNKKD